MLCFDPTRGIDIGTKQQIYVLLRELAAAGAAVLLYTSELKEIQLACDRAIVIFGGRVVAEIPVDDADEPTLLRAAYDLPPDAAMPEEVAATELEAEAADPAVARSHRTASCHGSDRIRALGVRMSAAVDTRATERGGPGVRGAPWARRNSWTLASSGCSWSSC